MSALTDLFTAMANKIRSKTGTATTYTPSEMVSDGIDDVYDAGVASVPQPTNITPSNSSPVSLTANTAVKPTTNGYAIASYDNVTPSSTAVSVAADDIVKIGGSGVIVDSVPTPTSITPSNSNPVPMYENTAYEPTVRGIAIADFINAVPSNSSPQSLVSGNIYKSQGNGYGIASYNSITPSNSSPVSLSSGSFYKPSASGYAISSYSSKTPSDTSPASVSSGAIIKASSSGYLYKTGLPILGQQPNAEFSNNTAGTSGSVNITVTQKPRYIIMSISSRTSAYLHQLGVIDVTGEKAWRMGCNADGTYSENWSNYTTYFTTISASKVTFSYAAANYNKRVVIQIYY